MADLRFEQTQSAQMQMRPEMRQALRIEQAGLLDMPDADFRRLVAETEASPVFRKLCQQGGVIRRQRAARTDVSSEFYGPKAEQAPDRRSFSVDEVLESREAVLALVRRLGQERFKKYFLFPEGGLTAETIAGQCGLKPAEVELVNRFVDEFAVASEFHQEGPAGAQGIHYTRIASIEQDREGLFIGFASACLARGSYVIDYHKFEDLAASGALSPSEEKEAKRLFKKLELINTRKDTITNVLKGIIDRQSLYLNSGNSRSLLPLSQKELAVEAGIAPSTLSRAIQNKSVMTPWGHEMALKSFFPRPRRFRREALRQLLAREHDLRSDEAVRAKLRDEFGVDVSRRSVANMRQELKLSPLGRRGARRRAV